MGRAVLSKTLIQLFADEWICAPSRLVFWSEVTLVSGSTVGLMVSLKRVYAQGAHPRTVAARTPIPMASHC